MGKRAIRCRCSFLGLFVMINSALASQRVEDSAHIFVTSLRDDGVDRTRGSCRVTAHDTTPLDRYERERLGLGQDPADSVEGGDCGSGAAGAEEHCQSRELAAAEDCTCTLRDALELAQTLPLAATVVIRVPRGVIYLTAQLPNITRALTISGTPPDAPELEDALLSADRCIALSQKFPCPDERRGQPHAPLGAVYPLCSMVDGGRMHRAFVFDPASDRASAHAVGLTGDSNYATLTLQHLRFQHCHASRLGSADASGHGGVMRMLGSAHLRTFNCDFFANRAEVNGGAIQAEDGEAHFYQVAARRVVL